MKEILLSFNPIFIIIGILLTGMAAFTANDLFLHRKITKSNQAFIFWGSNFSLSISIWMMNFFGILALDINNSEGRTILISFLSMIPSYLITSLALSFFKQQQRIIFLIAGSAMMSLAVCATGVIHMYAINGNVHFSMMVMLMSFILLTVPFILSFWILFRYENTAIGWISSKFVSSFINTITIGIGFLLVMKASFAEVINQRQLVDKLTLNGYSLIYFILFLSILIFGAFVAANLAAFKKTAKNHLFANDIMAALESTSIITILDPKGSFTYVNPTFNEVFQYGNDDLIGQHHSLLTRSNEAELFDEIKRNLEVNRPWKGELKGKVKDDGEIWVHATVTPFFNKKGEPYQYVAILTDISERKAVDKELKSSLKEIQDYRYALDQASIVAITDASGKIMKVNGNLCRISQYSPSELIGQDHRILNSAYHPKSFFEDLWRTISKGNVWQGEIRNKAKDGSFYWVETTIVPFLDDNQKPYQYVSIRNDITERKKQEAMLHRQDKLSALGQLAAGVAHEIRNPLTSMKGYTEYLLLDEESEDRREHLGIVLEEIERIDGIVEEFMMLAKPQPDLMTVKNISTIVSNTAGLFSYEAKKNKIQIMMDHIEEEAYVLCDENRMRQLFMNLLKNAIEAMPDGGILHLSVRNTGKEISIAIRDTGTGIPEEIMEHIGEPFFTTKEAGTGLGLMISHKIIENHNGKMEIESEHRMGTIFRITLPAVDPELCGN